MTYCVLPLYVLPRLDTLHEIPCYSSSDSPSLCPDEGTSQHTVPMAAAMYISPAESHHNISGCGDAVHRKSRSQIKDDCMCPTANDAAVSLESTPRYIMYDNGHH